MREMLTSLMRAATLLLVGANWLPEIRPARDIYQDNFEDFLLNMEQPQRIVYHPATAMLSRTSDDEDLASIETGSGRKSIEIKDRTYIQDVRLHRLPCCLLGRIAGEKAFHCRSHIYHVRMQLRKWSPVNDLPNTAGFASRKQRSRVALMSNLQRCVWRRPQQFHRCCYAARVEKRKLSNLSRRPAAVRSSRN